MVFLTVEDFKSQIKEDNLDQVINNDQSILFDAELKGIQEMESFLATRFDTANIFNRTGTERNALIVMYLVDIVLYHIHSRINPRKIPDLRGIRYEAAIKWLTMISKGFLAPKLPGITLEKDETDTISYVGQKKRRNRV